MSRHKLTIQGCWQFSPLAHCHQHMLQTCLARGPVWINYISSPNSLATCHEWTTKSNYDEQGEPQILMTTLKWPTFPPLSLSPVPFQMVYAWEGHWRVWAPALFIMWSKMILVTSSEPQSSCCKMSHKHNKVHQEHKQYYFPNFFSPNIHHSR